MSIPASSIVNVKPGVLAAGGTGFSLSGLFLTLSTLMPTNQVLSFSSAQAVRNFFGIGSPEDAAATTYFKAATISTLTPGAMLFAAFNQNARAAFLTSGSFAGVSLTTLQAMSGTLTISVDGAAETSSNISLAGATSFSNAAALIQAGFTNPGFAVTYNGTTNQFVFTNSVTGASSTLSFATGTLAVPLLLTSATGATLSQGAAPDTPTSAMNNAYANSQNWMTMVLLYQATLTDMETFAQWFNAQNDAFLWLAWDGDAQASVNGATEPFGVVAKNAQYDGVAAIGGDPVAATAAGQPLIVLTSQAAIFVSGAIAAIDFSKPNGRTDIAFLSQSGLLTTVANQQTAANLLANGYSYYGSYSTRANPFNIFYNGNMPGPFKWIDTYINDAWMNDQAQNDLMTLLTSVGSAAYNPSGYGLIRTALTSGFIAKALNFGAIRTGVTLSATQIADVNQAADQAVDSQISTDGYYLQILDPGAQTRQQRGSPVINFFYTDGGSIQQINLSSTDII